MTDSVGWASLDIVPRMARGFEGRLSSALGPGLDRSGRAAGSRFGSSFARSFTTVAGAGIGLTAVKLVKDSVTLEASYSKTFRLIGAAADVPKGQLASLNRLAQQLGTDTIFSANDAADAMLELVKNGLTPATIQAGALNSALTLATAGDLPLDVAAQTMSNTLNAFSLKGKDAAAVAAALAGAANASSASVEDLAYGLQQSSAVAHDAGLTVQETTGALAAFANAGIAGSDAGTSLKTMLSRLVPQTKKARDEMSLLGLDFTDAQGEFLPLAAVAGQLHDKLGGLSAEERTTALNTIFGSDARRAATVLMNEGKKGVEDYTKATSDQTQAQKLAKAAMEGNSGALERLRGNVETAERQFGKGLRPVVRDVADGLSDMLQAGDFKRWGRSISDGLHDVAKEYGPLGGELKDLGFELLPAIGTTLGTVSSALETAAPFATDLVKAFNDAPEWVQNGTVFAGLGLLAGKKLNLFGGAKGGGFGVSQSRPLPVYVVNGTGGIPGLPTRGAAAGGKGTPSLPLLGAPILPGAFPDGPTGVIDKKDLLPKSAFDDMIADRQAAAALQSQMDKANTSGLAQLLLGQPGPQDGLETFLTLDTKDANDRVDRLRARIEKPMHLSVILGNVSSAVDAAGNAVQEFLGGGGSTSHHHRAGVGRIGGVNVQGDLVVHAQDYRDMQRQLQGHAQQANLGGRPAGS